MYSKPICLKCVLLLVSVLIAAVSPSTAQVTRSTYLEVVKKAAEAGWTEYPETITRWKANVNPSVLWGYDAPAQPIYLADLLSFLYEQSGNAEYARRTAQILSEFGDLREAYPEDYDQARAEYANGVPALANFFFLPPYSRSYMRIRNMDGIDTATRKKIEADLAHSLDFVFHFPEWGAHNRAMLRAEGLYFGALALPDHPNAPRWKQMAEVIASDNLNQWEIEDASIYHPVWLESMFSYAEISGNEWIYDYPILRYYAEYFKRLLTPASTIPDFGDANWNPSWFRYVAVFEKLASQFRDPELKWAAHQLFEKNIETLPAGDVVTTASLVQAYRWADETLATEQPTSLSQEVLEDVVGKKIVFRNGWDPTSTFLLLNYRDEGDGGFVHREFLRHTISVEEEKMHHGHSDENDISLLMSGGSVLLHDSGYRDGLPSGAYGGYRSDYYHNRIVVRPGKRDRFQSLPEYIRNSGAYRPVETQKIDFLTLKEVDMSRTRLRDELTGFTWDRIITYVKPEDFFIVVDAVRTDVTDYFTLANLWHTRQIHEQGDHYYVTSIDSIQTEVLPQDKRLLIQFLSNEAKSDSFYTENRHYQEEKAIYQTLASHYLNGAYEIFVTVLIPHDVGAPIAPLLGKVRLLPTEDYPRTVGLEIDHGDSTSILGLKVDLESELARENIRPRYTWENGRVRYGDLETDAHFVYATVAGDRIRYSASNVLKVIYDGKTLMESLPNTHGLQLDGSPDRTGYVKWRYWEDTADLN